MKLTVHDVGHGQCVSLIHENGNTMVWDCGHKDGSKPSTFLPAIGINKIDTFFVSNYDEDHISDLPGVRSALNIRSLCRNKTISGEQLRILKQQGGPITGAMESMLEMIGRYTGGPLDPPPQFPGVTCKVFHNSYSADFDDSNNISLVTFLTCNNKKFVIPGDLEGKGWKGLLRQQGFVKELANVNVIIASHHGRESGYLCDVLDFARLE